MSGRDPLLWLIAGPNGAGKSTYYQRKIRPVLRAEFVNADLIAAERWPGDAEAKSYEAARIAAERRDSLLRAQKSFVAETVFSHPSKLDLLRDAKRSGYLVWLTVVGLESVELSAARVRERVVSGGHSVPLAKLRARYDRVGLHLREAVTIADKSFIVDNSYVGRGLRDLATYEGGRPAWVAKDLPAWVERFFPELREV